MEPFTDLIELLRSERIRRRIDSGELKLGPAASVEELDKTCQQFGRSITSYLEPLLHVTSGLTIGGLKGGLMDFDFNFPPNISESIWKSVYPVALEMVSREEMLYWDFTQGWPGPVYIVDHNFHWIALRFETFTECVKYFLDSKDPTAGLDKGINAVQSPTVAEVALVTKDSSLSQFLQQFPRQYEVHDLRGARAGAAFYYNSEPKAFVRFGSEPLWVEQHNKGLISRFFSCHNRV